MMIDYENSKKYYEMLKPCACGYCQLYCSKISECYPEIKKYLASIGVDISKPFELLSYSRDREVVYYDCMYIVFGQCEDDFNEDIGEVNFWKNDGCHPDEDISERHFILDFGPVTLNWDGYKN